MSKRTAVKWEYNPITIRDYALMYPSIDTQPVGQRIDTESSLEGIAKPSKAQAIINSILEGGDIGEIKIMKLLEDMKYAFESIDGGHRKRYIRDFMLNEFKLHKSSVYGEKHYSEFTDEERKEFLNYNLRFIVYDWMPNDIKGKLFRDTNTTTPVNQQEHLNSYGDTPIANLIRNTARIVDGVGNTPHPLFDINITAANNVRYPNVGFTNKRLHIDEMVARITYMIWKGSKVNTASFDELKEMYDADIDENEAKTIGKKLNEVLDFMLRVSLARKQLQGYPISNGMAVMLYRMYFKFKEMFGDFKIDSYHDFFVEFEKSFNQFDPKNPDKRTDIVENDRLIHEAFNQHLGEHKTLYKTENTISWMLEGMDLDKATVQSKDVKRTFDRRLVEMALANQGYRDWVDGKPLTMKDAEGGHIIPHSKGGRTAPDNLVVISREHNRRMQDINANDYKRAFLAGQLG